MNESLTSPEITRLSWGRVEVGDDLTFKDVKLYPGGAKAWNWEETGTGHTPGIQPSDVLDLVKCGAEVIILTNGVLKRLGVMDQTLAILKEVGVETHVLQTEEAVRFYNELRKSTRVGALIHSTC